MSASGRRKILIVGCGFPQLGLLRAARELELWVVGVDSNPSSIGAAVCDEFRRVSTHDVEAIARVAGELGVDGVTTAGSELALSTTVRVCEGLGLPFYGDAATVDRCQSKDRMRRAYQAGGAPIPAFAVAGSLAEVRRFIERQGLPVVVKPSRGWGQRGVSKVEVEAEVAPAFERARGASETGLVMVESFVEGDEVSVNAYTLDGATTVCSVTERVITHYPDPPGITFAEWYPSGLDRDAEGRAIEAALAGIRALGIERGPTYTQLRVGPGGAKIVETAYRLGGGLDPDVALLASGVSLFRKILGVALGIAEWERAEREREPHGGAIGKFLVARPGRVSGIFGLESARSMPGVVAAETYVSPGSTVFPLTDGSKRAGHVLVEADNRREAGERADSAAAAIRIETE